jgi:hypothetical protein
VNCRAAARTASFTALSLGAWSASAPALAHTSERAYVLLLPTGYYIAGGAIMVALSFALMFLLPAATARRISRWRLRLCVMPRLSATALSGISLLVLLLLLIAGGMGSRDPLENPLPLSIWTLWWVGFTIAHALFGNLWAALNPWLAPCRLLRRVVPAPRAYPDWLGYWPALLSFLGFAWFELIDPAPDDPDRLAVVVAGYWLATLMGMLLFGERDWLARAECFSVFFGFIARLSPFQSETAERRSLVLRFPGASLPSDAALPVSGVLFVLLTLATVSFDGLNKTFWWLDLGGINPLEFPGRTAVMTYNGAGLVAAWALLTLAYASAIAFGRRFSGAGAGLGADLGAFALSILPISLAYHFAHYLTIFLVNGQYALLALSDPFGLGWNLLGLNDRYVTTSFLGNLAAVSIIWRLQVGAVVLGHVLAIALAHFIAVERLGGGGAALRHQLPLAVLMIGYTLFGLWLLAAPMAG